MVLLAVLLLPAAVMAVQTPYGESGIPFEVQQAPGTPVYYVIGQSGVPEADNEGMTSNAGFVITAEGVVVYDALGTPALGYRLLQAIRAITDKPVTHVIAGHYHADHVYGLQAFREHTDATIWAQQRAQEYIGSDAAEQRLDQRREALYPWIDENTYLVKPDELYEDRKTFDMGDTDIVLIHAGPAHSPADTILVVKAHGVVFSGDLIFGGRLPFIGEDVNTASWLEGLEYLQELDPEPSFVIPGHGEASSDPAGAIAFTREYIEYLREQMGDAVDQLTPFATAYSNTDWSRYRDVPTFDAANRGNANRVYLEMEAALFK